MEHTETNLDQMGRRIRQVIMADKLTGDAIRRGRTALLEEVGRRNVLPAYRRPSRGWGSRWVTLALATVISGGALGLLWWTQPGSFQIGQARAGQLGDKIESPAGSPTQLRFSEGSTVLLHEGGRMRVLAFDRATAQVLVEDGTINVSIERQKIGTTDWNFEAGPYHLRATGTKLQLAVHASDQSISLFAQEGEVLVSGGCQETPRTVSEGERAELSCLPREAQANRRQARR